VNGLLSAAGSADLQQLPTLRRTSQCANLSPKGHGRHSLVDRLSVILLNTPSRLSRRRQRRFLDILGIFGRDVQETQTVYKQKQSICAY
jgi:hypothetical protein